MDWAKTGSMAEARIGHTATLLLDGRVLVAGGHQGIFGVDPDEAFASVELFDPATGMWNSGPSMPGGRTAHDAIRLNDGRVLLFGGYTKPFSPRDGMADDAALFDPATQAWTTIDAPFPGAFGTPLLLPDGRVLVNEFPVAYYTAAPPELTTFDPSTATWTTVAKGDEVRGEPTALLPDGSVLMVPAPAWRSGSGGAEGSVVLSSIAWRYDPVTDRWTELAAAPFPLDIGLAARLSDGRVVLIGPRWSVIYDANAGTWDEEDTPAYVPELANAIPLVDGRVVFVGARDCIGGTLPAQVLEIEHWYAQFAWGLENPVGGSTTLLEDGRILVSGGKPACRGYEPPQRPTSDAYLLDPATFAGFPS